MPSALSIQQVERRLVELGCPEKILRHNIRELAEHHEDLKQDALEEGLSDADAETRANKLLGEPVALAEQLAAALRQSSWWGRHPFLGFCIFPPFAILSLLSLGLWADLLMGRLYFSKDQISILTDWAEGFRLVKGAIEGAYFVAIMLTAMLFCKLARRTIAGMKWAFIACGVCALHGYLAYVWVAPHNLSVGFSYGSQANWIATTIPLCIAFIAWWKLRCAANQLAPLPAETTTRAVRREIAKTPLIAPSRWVTPTSIIMTLLITTIVILSVMIMGGIKREHMRDKELRSKIWPAEHAAVIEQLAARQSTKETHHETTIDLSKHVNMGLLDLFNGKPGLGDNNLAELPLGINIYGGVPFDVRGKVQLFGRTMADFKTRFHSKVTNIAIGRKCRQIYLLHGAHWISEESQPVTVARLILHYSDGSQSEIAIKAHEHLLNWQGPIYTTDNLDRLPAQAAPATELAWTGSNAWLKKNRPNGSLRLYRTAFENPHPELEIAGVDYVSALTASAPFMVGMTVE